MYEQGIATHSLSAARKAAASWRQCFSWILKRLLVRNQRDLLCWLSAIAFCQACVSHCMDVQTYILHLHSIYIQNHCLPLILYKPILTCLRGSQERTKVTMRTIPFGPNLSYDHVVKTAVLRHPFWPRCFQQVGRLDNHMLLLLACFSVSYVDLQSTKKSAQPAFRSTFGRMLCKRTLLDQSTIVGA